MPSQVYALVGSGQKGQVLGGMVAAGAGKFISFKYQCRNSFVVDLTV